MTPALRFDFDFLYYQDGDAVVAHCLQTDTAAFGDDVASAREALRASLELRARSRTATPGAPAPGARRTSFGARSPLRSGAFAPS